MTMGQSVESWRLLNRSIVAACRSSRAGLVRRMERLVVPLVATLVAIFVDVLMDSSPSCRRVETARRSAGLLVQSTRFPRGNGRSLSSWTIEAPSIARDCSVDPIRAAAEAETPRRSGDGRDRRRSMAVEYSAVVRVWLQILFGRCSCKQDPIARGSRDQVGSVGRTGG